MVFPRENPSIFEGERKYPLSNVEVSVRKRRENKVFRTNLFSWRRIFAERNTNSVGVQSEGEAILSQNGESCDWWTHWELNPGLGNANAV